MLIGIIIALAFLMFGAMKGWSILVIAPVGALIAGITVSGIDLLDLYTVEYMTGVGSYIISWFPMFLLGAIFGELMKESGAAASIARTIIRKLGAQHAILAVMLSIIVMVVGGISIFTIVFAVYPFMLICFKEADLPQRLMPGVVIGGIIVSESSIPGNPQIQNLIPTSMLGVDPMGGPIIGFTGFLVMTIMAVFYLNWEARRLKKQGYHFEDERNELGGFDLDNADLPNFWLCLVPIVVIIVLLNVVKLDPVISVAAGTLLMFLMFFKRLIKGVKGYVATACANSMPAIMNTACATGFGAVVQILPGFDQLVELLDGLVQGNPYLFAYIAVNILAGVSGSASGGMTIALNAVGERLLATGAHPGALARVVAISSVGLDSLPHNGAIVTIINYCGQDHKKSYFPMFIVSVVIPVIAGALAVIMANLGIA